MKQHIADLIDDAINTLSSQDATWQAARNQSIQITPTKSEAHGDFACNLPFLLAKELKRKPRDIAQDIVAALAASQHIEKIDIAGPGFINFYLSSQSSYDVVGKILQAGSQYGQQNIGQGKQIYLEFLSTNPTGPLHVGHGRIAAFGACVGNLLNAMGYQVHREFYVNDAGRQIDILTVSVWLRYLARCGETVTFPKNGYQGDYIAELAQQAQHLWPHQLHHGFTAIFQAAPADEQSDGSGDKEAHIDGLINQAKTLLGEHYRALADLVLNSILADMRDDLSEFGIGFDHWYSEHTLHQSGALTRAIEAFEKSGYSYQKDGATWFKASHFGDEKDRVIIRENGQFTYFASDIAYHLDKLTHGATQLIDVFGADHHGYVPRLKASLQATGHDPEQLNVLLVQFVSLYRGTEKVQMSTRSGNYVTLRELREQVGNDVARFFYVMRKAQQALDFDLELAQSQSSDNPVYYIQYAHARIASCFKQCAQQGIAFNPTQGLATITTLTLSHEQQLIRSLNQYSNLLEQAALSHEPHRLAHYLTELATHFHSYYNAHKFITLDNPKRMQARLSLIAAIQHIIANGLHLLGVTAPDSM